MIRTAVLLAFVLLMLTVFVHVGVAGASPAWDFEHYYAGAKIVQAGLADSLYDISVQHSFETRFGHGPGAVFNYPAVTVLLYWPIAFLELNRAFLAWTAISMAIAMIAVWLLARVINIPDPWWTLFLSLAFYPLQYSLISGQIDSFLLLAFVLALAGMKAKRPHLGGFALALGLFKFHLILPFVFIMLVRRQWRFVLGFACGSSIVVALCAAVSGIAQFTDYPRLLMTMQSLPDGGFEPWRMPNVRGLIFSLSGHEAPFWILILIAMGVLIWTAGRYDKVEVEAGFAAALTATVFTTYHVYVYDLVLLIIPLAVLATRLQRITALKAAILVLLAVPVFPWWVTNGRVSVMLVVPTLMLFWATVSPVPQLQSGNRAAVV